MHNGSQCEKTYKQSALALCKDIEHYFVLKLNRHYLSKLNG